MDMVNDIASETLQNLYEEQEENGISDDIVEDIDPPPLEEEENHSTEEHVGSNDNDVDDVPVSVGQKATEFEAVGQVQEKQLQTVGKEESKMISESNEPVPQQSIRNNGDSFKSTNANYTTMDVLPVQVENTTAFDDAVALSSGQVTLDVEMIHETASTNETTMLVASDMLGHATGDTIDGSMTEFLRVTESLPETDPIPMTEIPIETQINADSTSNETQYMTTTAVEEGLVDPVHGSAQISNERQVDTVPILEQGITSVDEIVNVRTDQNLVATEKVTDSVSVTLLATPNDAIIDALVEDEEVDNYGDKIDAIHVMEDEPTGAEENLETTTTTAQVSEEVTSNDVHAATDQPTDVELFTDVKVEEGLMDAIEDIEATIADVGLVTVAKVEEGPTVVDDTVEATTFSAPIPDEGATDDTDVVHATIDESAHVEPITVAIERGLTDLDETVEATTIPAPVPDERIKDDSNVDHAATDESADVDSITDAKVEEGPTSEVEPVEAITVPVPDEGTKDDSTNVIRAASDESADVDPITDVKVDEGPTVVVETVEATTITAPVPDEETTDDSNVVHAATDESADVDPITDAKVEEGPTSEVEPVEAATITAPVPDEETTDDSNVVHAATDESADVDPITDVKVDEGPTVVVETVEATTITAPVPDEETTDDSNVVHAATDESADVDPITDAKVEGGPTAVVETVEATTIPVPVPDEGTKNDSNVVHAATDESADAEPITDTKDDSNIAHAATDESADMEPKVEEGPTSEVETVEPTTIAAPVPDERTKDDSNVAHAVTDESADVKPITDAKVEEGLTVVVETVEAATMTAPVPDKVTTDNSDDVYAATDESAEVGPITDARMDEKPTVVVETVEATTITAPVPDEGTTDDSNVIIEATDESADAEPITDAKIDEGPTREVETVEATTVAIEGELTDLGETVEVAMIAAPVTEEGEVDFGRSVAATSGAEWREADVIDTVGTIPDKSAVDEPVTVAFMEVEPTNVNHNVKPTAISATVSGAENEESLEIIDRTSDTLPVVGHFDVKAHVDEPGAEERNAEITNNVSAIVVDESVAKRLVISPVREETESNLDQALTAKSAEKGPAFVVDPARATSVEPEHVIDSAPSERRSHEEHIQLAFDENEIEMEFQGKGHTITSEEVKKVCNDVGDGSQVKKSNSSTETHAFLGIGRDPDKSTQCLELPNDTTEMPDEIILKPLADEMTITKLEEEVRLPLKEFSTLPNDSHTITQPNPVVQSLDMARKEMTGVSVNPALNEARSPVKEDGANVTADKVDLEVNHLMTSIDLNNARTTKEPSPIAPSAALDTPRKQNEEGHYASPSNETTGLIHPRKLVIPSAFTAASESHMEPSTNKNTPSNKSKKLSIPAAFSSSNTGQATPETTSEVARKRAADEASKIRAEKEAQKRKELEEEAKMKAAKEEARRIEEARQHAIEEAARRKLEEEEKLKNELYDKLDIVEAEMEAVYSLLAAKGAEKAKLVAEEQEKLSSNLQERVDTTDGSNVDGSTGTLPGDDDDRCSAEVSDQVELSTEAASKESPKEVFSENSLIAINLDGQVEDHEVSSEAMAVHATVAERITGPKTEFPSDDINEVDPNHDKGASCLTDVQSGMESIVVAPTSIALAEGLQAENKPTVEMEAKPSEKVAIYSTDLINDSPNPKIQENDDREVGIHHSVPATPRNTIVLDKAADVSPSSPSDRANLVEQTAQAQASASCGSCAIL